MKMLKRPHCSLICAFLCISFSLPAPLRAECATTSSGISSSAVEALASEPVRGVAAHPSQAGAWAPLAYGAVGGTPLGGKDSTATDSHLSPALRSAPVPVSPELSAALCEMAAWGSADKAGSDSLLLLKASFLQEAGQPARAYETLCRISRFGLSQPQRTELLRRKLLCTWEAGLMDEFRGLLDEAGGTPLLSALPACGAAGGTPLGDKDSTARPRHRNEDLAMILSVIPGAGCAYAGDLPGAGKYFLAGASTIALGIGAFASGLYVSAFLGGGMLLYTILPPSTDHAIKDAADFNNRTLKDHYAPIYNYLLNK